jgi:hypothetical protein
MQARADQRESSTRVEEFRSRGGPLTWSRRDSVPETTWTRRNTVRPHVRLPSYKVSGRTIARQRRHVSPPNSTHDGSPSCCCCAASTRHCGACALVLRLLPTTRTHSHCSTLCPTIVLPCAGMPPGWLQQRGLAVHGSSQHCDISIALYISGATLRRYETSRSTVSRTERGPLSSTAKYRRTVLTHRIILQAFHEPHHSRSFRLGVGI